MVHRNTPAARRRDAWVPGGKSLIKTTKACLFQCKPACMPYQIKYSARPDGGPSAMRCRPNRAVKLHTPLYTDYSLYSFQMVVKKLLQNHKGPVPDLTFENRRATISGSFILMNAMMRTNGKADRRFRESRRRAKRCAASGLADGAFLTTAERGGEPPPGRPVTADTRGGLLPAIRVEPWSLPLHPVFEWGEAFLFYSGGRGPPQLGRLQV